MERYEFNLQLAEAARSIAEENDTEQTLDRSVRLAIDLIPHCDLAGFSIFSPGGVQVVASSGDNLQRIDELQQALGEGPCMSAERHRDVVAVGNVSSDPRWPRWGPRIAQDFNIRSAMSFRLFTEGHRHAALNLYAEKPDVFDHEDLIDGLVVAAQAAVTMASALQLDHLQQAMRSRQVIGEAGGMLRERFGLSSERAFEVLKRLSSQQNVKLIRIAQHIVETGDLPDTTGSAAPGP